MVTIVLDKSGKLMFLSQNHELFSVIMILSVEPFIPYVVSIFHNFPIVAKGLSLNWPVLETLKETGVMSHIRKDLQSSLTRVYFQFPSSSHALFRFNFRPK